MDFQQLVEFIGRGFDLVGVVALIGGAVVAITTYLHAMLQRPSDTHSVYRTLRQGLGRAILVGLELLVAADIIRTVAIQPTFQSVGVLGVIVIIRTFLSWSLEVEINGQWPWRRASDPVAPGVPTRGEEM